MGFPKTRMRRLRASAGLRGLVRETDLRAGQLVLPMFVAEAGVGGAGGREPIATMPGVERLSLAAAVEEAREVAGMGIAAVMLFGIPAEKDEQGSGAWDEEGVVQLATRAIKQAVPELLVVTDVCLCEYTSHGHCGLLRDDGVGRQRRLARAARTHRRQPCPRGRRHRRAVGHDGRPRGRHPRGARRRRARRDADHRLLGEVRLGVLRAVPRRRRLGAGVRRPARVPDGPRERARGGARGDARRARRAPTW